MKNHSHHSFPPSRRVLFASAVALLVSTGSVFAQTGGAAGNPSSTTRTADPYKNEAADVAATKEVNARTAATAGAKLSWGDRRFVTKAADGGQTEVQIAQLAAQRATNTEVRAFAQKLVDEHSKVNSELLGLASQKNVKVDTDDDKDRAYKRLNKKSGAEFDEEFVEHMIDEHEKTIKMFEKASTDTKDSELRAFASKHVSALRSHLQQAQSLRQTLMPTGRIDDSSGRSSTSPESSRTRSSGATTSGGETIPTPTPKP